jgi:hypothetical protein
VLNDPLVAAVKLMYLVPFVVVSSLIVAPVAVDAIVIDPAPFVTVMPVPAVIAAAV